MSRNPLTSSLAAASLAALTVACTGSMNTATQTQPVPAPAQSANGASTNPLLQPWTGPYGGVPAFDRVKVADFKPAMEAAMAEALAGVDRIANSTEPATFANTKETMDRNGKALHRERRYDQISTRTSNTHKIQPVEREMAPKLAAFSSQINQNTALFKRIEAVYNSPDKSKLTPEQQRLAWLYYTNAVRAGAKLDDASKARLTQINQRLAALFTSFNQNVLADESQKLTGPNGETITNTRSSVEPFLTYSDNREFREKVWRMFVNRGESGATANQKNITEILQLRAERAKLLGYPTHAHWRLENAMAKTPERAMELMEAVWTPAVARVKEEVADMQKLANAEGANITIEPWDYRYYAEKVRKQRYDLDQNAVKPYLQLEKLREGMFWVAGELFGFQFTPVTNVPVYHPDVRVWEVKDRTSGKHIGLWYFDPYARPGKRSGAWMNAYRTQQKFDTPVTTIVSNNSNFVKGNPGEPVLISWTDATTLFHEFGHALHGLSSNVNYPSLAGTAVARDYVEFPSQLLEHWLATPQVLQKFALHYQTGEPIPQALVDRIKRADTFNEGFDTIEYLSAALVDMKMHLAGSTPIDPAVFERETLTQLGMPKEIVMRHRPTQFLHVFGSDGYSAGYYSYLWSDVITADAALAFTEAGGLYDPSVAKRLRDNVFAIGNTVDPADAYRAFRGRDPQIEGLLRKRGFLPPTAQ